jgi:DnaJ-class molecular chaperone
MSVHVVRCPCRGRLECKLCHGTKVYEYDVGPGGWLPFTCPMCEGKGTLPDGDTEQRCFTCHGAKTVDPANPPPNESPAGVLRKIWKIFFGG